MTVGQQIAAFFGIGLASVPEAEKKLKERTAYNVREKEKQEREKERTKANEEKAKADAELAKAKAQETKQRAELEAAKAKSQIQAEKSEAKSFEKAVESLTPIVAGIGAAAVVGAIALFAIPGKK